MHLDNLARQYLAAKLKKESADDELKRLRDKLIPLIRKQGFVPEKAEKSRRLETELYELTASFGESVKVDDEIAEQFVIACQESAAKEVREFAEQVFAWRVKYSLAAGAHQLMSAKLPPGAPRTLRTIFAKAVKVEPTSPSLTIKERKSSTASVPSAPGRAKSVPSAVADGSAAAAAVGSRSSRSRKASAA